MAPAPLQSAAAADGSPIQTHCPPRQQKDQQIQPRPSHRAPHELHYQIKQLNSRVAADRSPAIIGPVVETSADRRGWQPPHKFQRGERTVGPIG